MATLAVLTAGCSGTHGNSSTGGPAAGLVLSGGANATFPPGPRQTCSTTTVGATGQTHRSFVFNGAQSTGAPQYLLLFAVAPYHGSGEYHAEGGNRGVQVLLTRIEASAGLTRWGAHDAVLKVDRDDDKTASGSLDAHLVPLPGGAAVASPAPAALHLVGTWTCARLDTVRPSQSPHP